MNKGKTGKYLKYAIGEIVLVVIGILIALTLNNWNSVRIEKEKERELLQLLASDLERGIKDMIFNIELQDNGIQSAEIVLKHMDSNLPYADSIGEHIAWAFSWSKLTLNLGAYETIKSQGLEIIKNQDLRSQIVDRFEGGHYFHKELEDELVAYSDKIRMEIGVDFFLSTFKGLKNTSEGFYPGITVPRNYKELRKSPVFRYHLENYLNMNKGFQLISNRPYKNRLEALREAILIEIGAKATADQ